MIDIDPDLFLVPPGKSIRLKDYDPGWEGNKDVLAEDVAARKADLEKLRADKARLEGTATPVSGSFFKYRLVEVFFMWLVTVRLTLTATRPSSGSTS